VISNQRFRAVSRSTGGSAKPRVWGQIRGRHQRERKQIIQISRAYQRTNGRLNRHLNQTYYCEMSATQLLRCYRRTIAEFATHVSHRVGLRYRNTLLHDHEAAMPKPASHLQGNARPQPAARIRSRAPRIIMVSRPRKQQRAARQIQAQNSRSKKPMSAARKKDINLNLLA